jgi:hypothetical protein
MSRYRLEGHYSTKCFTIYVTTAAVHTEEPYSGSYIYQIYYDIDTCEIIPLSLSDICPLGGWRL